jgi:plastocyanin
MLCFVACKPANTTGSDLDAGRADGGPLTVTVTVGMNNSIMFSPTTQTIRVGDTVHWVWGSSGHSITSGPPCSPDGKFCSPGDQNCSTGTLQNAGDTYDHTFTEPGTFPYHCLAHCSFGMQGTIVVSP